MQIWNPWHGCQKISPGCQHCYVYRRDSMYGKDSSIVTKTGDFNLPAKKTRQGEWKMSPEKGVVFACMTSDFFLKDADEWRPEAWRMIRERSDIFFYIVTKRIHRFMECIPDDWGDGYENIGVICTCENQQMADFRLPIFLSAPIRHKEILMEPMLGEIHVEPYLADGQIEMVTCGGESGKDARVMDYAWVLSIRDQCQQVGVSFHFKQTGTVFRKDGRVYHIERKQQMSQAAKAGIDIGGLWK